MTAPEFDGRQACAEEDTDLFFPTEGGQGGGKEDKRAKAICARCVHRQPCLAYALNDPSVYGIWGGTNTRQRRDMRRRAAS